MKMTCSVFLSTALLLAPLSMALGDQGAPTLVYQGDAAYARFEYLQAADYYRKALEAGEQGYDTAWKRARTLIDLGDEIASADERNRYYQEAETMARMAVAETPNGAKGHLYLSIAIGKIALDEGPRERVRLSKEVKSAVDQALALDPTDDVAWHVLGRWHRRLAQLSWVEKGFADIFLGGVPKEAKVETAAECFRRAVELNPEHIHHHLELAMTLEEMGEREAAAVAYRRVLSLREKAPKDRGYKSAAGERLKKL